MRLPLKWLRTHTLLVSAVAVLVLVVLVFYFFWPREQVTQANFQRIELGMSQAELIALLGAPDSHAVELGFVTDSKTYAINFASNQQQLRERGFRNYQREQWISSEISIVVILDLDGVVVCKYSADGQKWSWFAFLRSRVSRLF